MSLDKEEAPIPCQNKGCSFWGRAATGGFCSKCYNEKLKADNNSTSPTPDNNNNTMINKPISSSSSNAVVDLPKIPTVNIQSVDSNNSNVSSVTTVSGDDNGNDKKKRKVQENKSRCFSCNKKVGLTGIECRCGYVYCGAHRYPDTHSCDFDYKNHGREILAKANEKVVGDKLGGEKL